jgi:hypothetical protein
VTKLVYTTGYSTRTPAQIKQIAETLDAIIFDIRFSPKSRVAHWSGQALAQLLGPRYKYVHALGNRNYQNRNEPVEIVAYEEGKVLIEQSELPVILLCACSPQAYLTCHRTVIGRRLQAAGFEVQELTTL